MRDITAVIEDFKSLALEKYPKQEIIKLYDEVGQIGEVGHIVVNLFPGFTIMRARPNHGEPRFNRRIQLSYKPAHLNTTYQRASTPSQTMFYGSLLPEVASPGELNNVRLICFAETMQRLADKTTCAHEKITFSKWEVIKEINLLSIIHQRDYYDKSHYTRELVSAYDKSIQSMQSDFRERSLKFSEYLSYEFSKEQIRGDYDYMISGLFTQMATMRGLDGVFYPSVRTAGNGFNLAITPEATKKLRLSVVAECTIYKRKDQTIIGNDAYVELKGNKKKFKMVDLKNNRKQYLNELGLNSIKDLKDCL